MNSVLPPRRLCVAPMMGRTDRHFRFLMRLIAPQAWLYTEMITSSALLKGAPQRLLRFDSSEHPVALQLGGNDATSLAAAARLGEDEGFDEINLNVGCPSGRVQKACFGAALMLDAERVADCVDAMCAAVRVPITIKTRLGVDEHDSYEFLENFVEIVSQAGCRTLILHARKAWLHGLNPKQNRDVPPLDYARVHRIKKEFPALEVIVNGGLVSAADTLSQLGHVDGVMLGRVAYRQPMIMAELVSRMFSHGDGDGDRVADRGAVMRAYCAYLARELERGTGLRLMTRHLAGLYAHQAGGRRFRRELANLPDGARGLQALENLVNSSVSAVAPTVSEVAA